MFKLINVVVFYKYALSVNLMHGTRFNKGATGTCLPLCYISFSLHSVSVWERFEN